MKSRLVVKYNQFLKNNLISVFQYQNISDLNIGLTVSEKTIRDLAARMSDRIGIPVRFEADISRKYKGKLEIDNAVVNLAYATLDTPIHEILGHPIIRVIKNRKEKIGYIEVPKSNAMKEGYQCILRTTDNSLFEENNEIKYYYEAESRCTARSCSRWRWRSASRRWPRRYPTARRWPCWRAAFARGERLDPALALPLYVRDKFAQTTAERAAARAGATP